MDISETEKIHIIALHKEGFLYRKIATKLKLSLNTVYRIIKEQNEFINGKSIQTINQCIKY